jgi:hypothetical protein
VQLIDMTMTLIQMSTIKTRSSVVKGGECSREMKTHNSLNSLVLQMPLSDMDANDPTRMTMLWKA